MADTPSNQKSELDAIDINRILEYLPHRYPMLLVDKVRDIIPGESALGIKNVTVNEPHFQGHFPGQPIMPGVLIVEAMAQTAAILAVLTMAEKSVGKLVYFMSIDKCRFRRPVVPGDVMEIKVVFERRRGTVWRFECEATVDGERASEAVLVAMIVDKQDD